MHGVHLIGTYVVPVFYPLLAAAMLRYLVRENFVDGITYAGVREGGATTPHVRHYYLLVLRYYPP